jgi:hypothetical protein
MPRVKKQYKKENKKRKQEPKNKNKNKNKNIIKINVSNSSGGGGGSSSIIPIPYASSIGSQMYPSSSPVNIYNTLARNPYSLEYKTENEKIKEQNPTLSNSISTQTEPATTNSFLTQTEPIKTNSFFTQTEPITANSIFTQTKLKPIPISISTQTEPKLELKKEIGEDEPIPFVSKISKIQENESNIPTKFKNPLNPENYFSLTSQLDKLKVLDELRDNKEAKINKPKRRLKKEMNETKLMGLEDKNISFKPPPPPPKKIEDEINKSNRRLKKEMDF